MKRFHHRAVVLPKPGDLSVPDGDAFDDEDALNPVDRERIVIHGNFQRSDNQNNETSFPNVRVETVHPTSNDNSRNVTNQVNDSRIVTEPVNDSRVVTEPVDSQSVTNQVTEEIKQGDKELDASEEYKIKKIIHARKAKNGSLEYLIDWEGFPASARTYEPYDHLNEEAKNYVDANKVPIVKQNYVK